MKTDFETILNTKTFRVNTRDDVKSSLPYNKCVVLTKGNRGVCIYNEMHERVCNYDITYSQDGVTIFTEEAYACGFFAPDTSQIEKHICQFLNIEF